MANNARIEHGKLTRRGSRGQSILEFALTLPFIVLILFGCFAIGISLERFLTVAQLVRHSGNMYARDISFDEIDSPARQLMVKAASGMKLSSAMGDCDANVKSVVYLTEVQITPDEPPGTFANEGKPVMMHRTLIGSACVGASQIGTPPNNIWDPNDSANPGLVQDAFNEPGAVATLPAEVVSEMIPGETVFVVEVNHEQGDLRFPGLTQPDSVYTRGFF